MIDYLTFVWESLKHPKSLVDLLAPFQLLLFVLFLYFIVRIIILGIKTKRK